MKKQNVTTLQDAVRIVQPYLLHSRNDDGPWSMTYDALMTTLRYIHIHLHHPCYLLCVSVDGRPSNFLKLEAPSGTAPVFKEAFDKLENDTYYRSFLQQSLRVMQCILKPVTKKTSFSYEYYNFFSDFKTQLSPGVYVLNITDAVILHKKGLEPFSMITGSRMLPSEFRFPATFLPILSTSGSIHHKDIAIPNYDDIQPQESNDKYIYDWNHKTIDKAVFRGSPTGCGWKPDTNQRLHAAFLSTKPQYNTLLDAGIVLPNNPTYVKTNAIRVDPKHGIGKVDEPTLLTSERLSMEEQSRYKYILHIDGNVHAYRLLTTLLTGSLILRVDSQYRGWLDTFLVSGVHYIPVRSDLSDLEKQILWCRSHDAECQRIAQQGRQLALQASSREFIETFFAKVMFSVSPHTKNNNCQPLWRRRQHRNYAVQSFYNNSTTPRLLTPSPINEIVNSKAKTKTKITRKKKGISVTEKEKESVTEKEKESVTEKVIIKGPSEKCPKGYNVDKKDKTRCLKKSK